MKLLFLIDSLGSGGAQRQMTIVADLLSNKGYEVSFLVYSEGDFFKKRLNDNNIPIVTIPSTNIIRRMFRIRKFIRCGNYDVVISFMDTPNFLNCFAATGGHSWKAITSERSAKKATFHNRKNRIFNWFQRYSDVIVCNSMNARSMWSECYPEYKGKLRVIYNTVNLSIITTSYAPLRDDKLHLVVAASYQGLKNPVNLVKALSLLTKYNQARIKIDWYGNKDVSQGGSSNYDESNKIITNNDLSSIIKLHEVTNDIHNIMYQADVIGLFSEYEGLPNVICEAMTIGKPIVITKVSDYNQFVDETNGIICEKTTPEEIALALSKLLKLSADDIIKMGGDSQNKARVLFNSEKIINQWENVINK